MQQLKVALVFGGRSGEHEISVLSARAILENLNPNKYAVTPIYVSRDGHWLAPEVARTQLQTQDVKKLQTTRFPMHLDLSFKPSESKPTLSWLEDVLTTHHFDIIFPVIHGTFGEDGTLQGFLEILGVPYVGAGVLASALGMDKSLMKTVCQAAGLPVLPAYTLTRTHWNALATQPQELNACLDAIEAIAGYPAFVKPCNLGSSVGISKVQNRAELVEGITEACRYDRKILIEKGLSSPREIELAVLGNDELDVSVPGEIIHGGDFYDYETKYFKTEGQKITIPADLAPQQTQEVQKLALQTYRSLDLNGLSRVDFLLDRSNNQDLYLNEVNTMPGFTTISMYSMLWKASGLNYPDLLDRLIELGFERHRDRNSNLTTC